MPMSIRVMHKVWEDPFILDQSELLVMLALADFCNDEGECWPSVSTVAKKARLTNRGVQKIMDRLISYGFLIKDVGGGRGKSNRYILNVKGEQRSLNQKQRIPFSESGSQETLNDVPKTLNGVQTNHHRTINEPSLYKKISHESKKEGVQGENGASAPTLKPKRFKSKPENYEELRTYVVDELSLEEDDAAIQWEKWVGNGFRVNGKPMDSWKHTLSSWERQRFFPSQKAKDKQLPAFGFAR